MLKNDFKLANYEVKCNFDAIQAFSLINIYIDSCSDWREDYLELLNSEE